MEKYNRGPEFIIGLNFGFKCIKYFKIKTKKKKKIKKKCNKKICFKSNINKEIELVTLLSAGMPFSCLGFFDLEDKIRNGLCLS
jgi:hypothetical protein